MNNEIAIGPLLGIESNELYTTCILVNQNSITSPKDIQLKVDANKVINPIQIEELINDFHFLRFEIPIKAERADKVIQYQFEYNGSALRASFSETIFEVKIPSANKNINVTGVSCSGSHGKSPEVMDSCGHYNGWKKLIEVSPDIIVMAGDQIYADIIWKEIPELKKLLTQKEPILDELIKRVDSFYLNLYIRSWSNQYMAKALATIPSVMNWDDHDIIDGYGSLNEDYQVSYLFKEVIFPIAKKYYSLFQIRGNNQSLIEKGYDFSLAFNFRDYQFIIPDTRTHRNRKYIIADKGYSNIKSFLKNSPKVDSQSAICFVLPVPIAHLKFNGFFETIVKYVFRFVEKWKTSGMIHSIDDDLLDHWEHKDHEEEQIKILNMIFEYGILQKPKHLIILSGDVHFSGASKVEYQKNDNEYNLTQVISSPMVNSPMPSIIAIASTLLSRNKYSLKEIGISDFKNFGSYKKPMIRFRNFINIESKTGDGGVYRSCACHCEPWNNIKPYYRRINDFIPAK